ncbi:hypothetical protein [uncultured Aquimarina sp.]|uniref:hypothetical protein n=1 Tax=uncultured Aquimarina sp. TaxID=575652 RepID=UPI00260D5F4C|nr:hypothetical protein [uncultured Aquimarina sp.]
MKYLFLLVFVFTSCKNTTNTEVKIEEKPESSITEKNEITKTSDNSFDMVFLAKAEGTDDDFFQKLGINWISLSEIQYDLMYDNQLCEGKCSGNAVRKDLKISPKINSYPEGDYKFSFIQFEDQKEDFKIIIRIQASSKKEAEIAFVYEKNIGDCSPYEALMLRIK